MKTTGILQFMAFTFMWRLFDAVSVYLREKEGDYYGEPGKQCHSGTSYKTNMQEYTCRCNYQLTFVGNRCAKKINSKNVNFGFPTSHQRITYMKIGTLDATNRFYWRKVWSSDLKDFIQRNSKESLEKIFKGYLLRVKFSNRRKTEIYKVIGNESYPVNEEKIERILKIGQITSETTTTTKQTSTSTIVKTTSKTTVQNTLNPFQTSTEQPGTSTISKQTTDPRPTISSTRSTTTNVEKGTNVRLGKTEKNEDSTEITGILVGVLSALVVLVLLIVSIILFKKRKLAEGQGPQDIMRSPLEPPYSVPDTISNTPILNRNEMNRSPSPNPYSESYQSDKFHAFSENSFQETHPNFLSPYPQASSFEEPEYKVLDVDQVGENIYALADSPLRSQNIEEPFYSEVEPEYKVIEIDPPLREVNDHTNQNELNLPYNVRRESTSLSDMYAKVDKSNR